MRRKLWVLALSAVAMPLAVAGCPTAGPDNVDFFFANETDFDVDTIVNGDRVGTVPAHGTATSSTNLCATTVDQFVISGTLLTPAGSFPSPSSVTFAKGDNFVCGDTIRVTYFLDANGDLDENGFASQ